MVIETREGKTMNDTTEDGDEPFVTLKNGPLDGVVIPQREKHRVTDGRYVGPGPYYPSYRVQDGTDPLIAEFDGYLR
jgi:hypothetical protein